MRKEKSILTKMMKKNRGEKKKEKENSRKKENRGEEKWTELLRLMFCLWIGYVRI